MNDEQVGGVGDLEAIAVTLHKFKEKRAAIEMLDAFGRHSFTLEQFDMLCKCFFKIKEYYKAIEYGKTMMTLAHTNPQMWTARSNMINVYNHANYPEKALELIKQQEIVNPNYLPTMLEKSYALFLQAKRDEAEELLRAALDHPDLDPETEHKINFNLGAYCLWKDNFQEGLKRWLIHGKKLNSWKSGDDLPFKFWEGGVYPGKDIILFAEAGIGDEIINIRFAKHLEKLGMNPIWYTNRKDLAKVFSRCGYNVMTSREQLDALDDPFWTYPMSLPIYLNLKYEELWDGSYIEASDEYKEKHNDLFKNDKLKIGIRWQGNPEYDQDLHRSIPLKEILKSIPDSVYDKSELYSLQRDDGIDEIWGTDLINLSDQMESWDDTLAIIDQLDIVITSCTSIAHAAAAMGKRVFVLVSITAYYTWNHSMEQSPWYGDNVTILRQEKPRSWKEPLKKLANELI